MIISVVTKLMHVMIMSVNKLLRMWGTVFVEATGKRRLLHRVLLTCLRNSKWVHSGTVSLQWFLTFPGRHGRRIFPKIGTEQIDGQVSSVQNNAFMGLPRTMGDSQGDKTPTFHQSFNRSAFLRLCGCVCVSGAKNLRSGSSEGPVICLSLFRREC